MKKKDASGVETVRALRRSCRHRVLCSHHAGSGTPRSSRPSPTPRSPLCSQSTRQTTSRNPAARMSVVSDCHTADKQGLPATKIQKTSSDGS